MASWLKCTTKRDEAAVFVYGFLKNDFVIIIANAVSLALLMGICNGKGFDQASSWR